MSEYKLIEQLGGYNMACAYHNSLSDGATSCFHNGVFYSKESLGLCLLEYRRQHNIFEVGDKVVYVDDFMHDEISIVSNIDDRVWLNSDNTVCIKDMLRHATDAEIQAGLRLDLEVLHDHDIPPNTIVVNK